MSECSICLEGFKNGSELQISCSHCFHKKCIRDWAKNNASCPLCRKRIDINTLFARHRSGRNKLIDAQNRLAVAHQNFIRRNPDNAVPSDDLILKILVSLVLAFLIPAFLCNIYNRIV